MAQKCAQKIGISCPSERAPLDLCIDPQFEMLKPLFKQNQSCKQSSSIYKSISPDVYLDLYGKLLPPKVEAWSLGPARPTFHFKPIKLIKEEN